MWGEAFVISTGAVALAEVGDKTQLLSLALASRYRRPVPIVLGILVATLANHTLAAVLGSWIAAVLGPTALRWVIGVSFIAMGLWVLIPDRLEQGRDATSVTSVFMATTLAFFMAEMADKTQVATVALAVRYEALVAVIAGTTAGMLLANVPVVWLGERAARRMPVRWVRLIAALLFIVLGFAALIGTGDDPSPQASSIGAPVGPFGPFGRFPAGVS
ncbi:MAG: TMEM165/GDT1 family protein [Burkholderiales bacterium]|nr:MAG: TMEM165/GDT1 family protein [Burkholderiales bacterium]